MKCVITKSELSILISKIQSLVANKPAIPLLSNVLIEAIDDQLILCVTDLTTSMRCYFDAKVIEEGAIALPARRFFNLIRELTSPQIKITSHANEIAEIVSGSSTFKIKIMNKNEFPKFPNATGATQMPVPSNVLKNLLSRCAFSAAREDSRFVINGILLHIENQKATFMATDGKRLAKISSKVDIDQSFQGYYIIPIRAVEEMVKILDDSEDIAYFSLMHDKLFLEYKNLTLVTKLLTGQYPDIESVIPTEDLINVTLHREELMTLLRQIALFISETNSSIRLFFEKGQLHLNALNSEIGEGHVSMAVDYSGKNIEIAFNPYYFLDILRHIKDETVKFSMKDSYNPGVITDSTDAFFVIMPMRISETPPPSQELNETEKPAFA